MLKAIRWRRSGVTRGGSIQVRGEPRDRDPLHRGLIHLFDGLNVQPLFVTEMIVDGSEIDGRALADLADGGGLVAFFREDRPGGFKNASFGIV
jgi:hypothetical protein